ncbi:MAG: hypothetical protein IT440_10720, partial [Phycisphaeraceae bacterium]|nr:hypothetical protein [Phycisphaeraceae bacterium]
MRHLCSFSRQLPIVMATTCIVASIAHAQSATWSQRADLAGIVSNVPVLKRPLPEGWQSTLFWWQVPLSYDNPAKLKEELAQLSARGILPCVEVPADYEDYRCYQATPEAVGKTVAQAKAIADAGYPVHLAMKGVLDLYITPGGPGGKIVRHPDAPNPDKKDDVGLLMPCLIMKDGWISRASQQRAIFKQFADAKVPVAGVWYDYEGHPHPWNGAAGMNMKCPNCRKAYPAGVLDDYHGKFKQWCENYHTKAMTTAFADPAHAFWPDVCVGFYDYSVSTIEHPAYIWSGHKVPPMHLNPASIGAVQPACYADSGCIATPENILALRRDCDPTYMHVLLKTVSNIHHNLHANQVLMPYVASYI